MTDEQHPAPPTGGTGPDREPMPVDGAPTEAAESAVGPDLEPVVPVAPDAGAGAAMAAVAAAPTAPRPSPARLLGYLGAAVLGIAIGVGGFALATGGPAATPGPSAAPSGSPAPTSGPTAGPVFTGDSIGSPDAPVTLEVWADYQCPFCRLEDLLFGRAVEREYIFPGTVRIVHRDFAFLGQESIDAAIGARCAGRQDPAARLRFHDTLYTFQQGENQGRFGRDNLVQMAQIAGVADIDVFRACLDDPAVEAEVAAETQAGRNLGIDSTPTLRLRGPGGERVLRGFSQTWPTLRDAIEAVRVPAPSASPAPSGSAPAGSPAPTATPSATATPGG